MTRKAIIAIAVAVFVSTLVLPLDMMAATRSKSRHSKYRKARFRRAYWNPLLKGSHESMLRQNEEIDRLGLPRIYDDDELDQLIDQNELVEIPETSGLRLAANLQANRRYCKPWTRDFVEDLGNAFYQEFGVPIQVNSAVRTVLQQKKLRRRNRNAAPIEGDTASSHLAGITVDINKRGISRKQHKWIESYFANLRDLGLIEVAEERRQPVFHVMVSERYAYWRDEQQNPERQDQDTDGVRTETIPAAGSQ